MKSSTSSSVITSGSSSTISTHMPSSDRYAAPASHFPDTQQFFFRFIVNVDHYRFLVHVEHALAARLSSEFDETLQQALQLMQMQSAAVVVAEDDDEAEAAVGAGAGAAAEDASPVKGISTTTTTTRSSSSSSSMMMTAATRSGRSDSDLDMHMHMYSADTMNTLARSVHRLCVLARFIGLLQFWPQWTLTLDAARAAEGPVGELLRAAAQRREKWGSLFPLEAYISRGITGHYLSLVLPWAVDFLSMASWHRPVGTTLPQTYLDAITTLNAHAQAHIVLGSSSLSGNR